MCRTDEHDMNISTGGVDGGDGGDEEHVLYLEQPRRTNTNVEVDVDVDADRSADEDCCNALALDTSPSGVTSPPLPSNDDGDGDNRRCEERHRVGIVPLAVLVFYSVSGGPFGCEASIRYGGVFYALLGFAVLPFVWSIPEALVTAELGSAYPEPSGGIAWVEEAFGGEAGLLAGYMTWVAGVTDNAIYPALFLDYVTSMLGSGGGGTDESQTVEAEVDDLLEHGWTRFVLLVSIALVLSYVNYRGLQIVGNASIVVCLLSMSPFVLLTILGAARIEPSRWMQRPDADAIPQEEQFALNSGWLPFPNYGGVLWRPFLNNLFWNLNSFDSAANFAGEVHDPARVFPRAVFWAVIMVVLSYFVPLLVATGATASAQSDWTEGHLATVASEVVGGAPWLGAWTVFASGVSNLALYEAEMSSDSLQIMGLAQRGMAPRLFDRRSEKYGTPTNGIVVGTVIVVLLSAADFSELIEMLNFAYSIALLMELAAFVKLRITHAHVPRPYRVPLNTAGCICMIVPTCALILLVLMLATWMTYIYVSLMVLVGVGVHRFYTQGGVPTCVRSGRWKCWRRGGGGFNTPNEVGQTALLKVSPGATVDASDDEIELKRGEVAGVAVTDGELT